VLSWSLELIHEVLLVGIGQHGDIPCGKGLHVGLVNLSFRLKSVLWWVLAGLVTISMAVGEIWCKCSQLATKIN
jgi:hypothetical protein